MFSLESYLHTPAHLAVVTSDKSLSPDVGFENHRRRFLMTLNVSEPRNYRVAPGRYLPIGRRVQLRLSRTSLANRWRDGEGEEGKQERAPELRV